MITKVNGSPVISGIQMSAQIAGFRPGDKVAVSYLRSGKEFNTNIILKKRTDVVSANAASRLGGELSTLDKSKARSYGIGGGVVVSKVFDQGAMKNSRIQPGFIITSVITSDGEVEVSSVDEHNSVLMNLTGTVRVQGIYPGYAEAYTYPVNLEQ